MIKSGNESESDSYIRKERAKITKILGNRTVRGFINDMIITYQHLP